MSQAFPAFAQYREAKYGFDSATTNPTQVATSASAHTKGSWVEFVASTPFPTTGLQVTFQLWSSASRRFLIDIGVGGAGSETVIIPDLWYRNQGSSGVSHSYFFPVAIPAGSRIAVRQQCSTGSTDLGVSLRLVHEGLAAYPQFTGVDALGMDSANTQLNNTVATDVVAVNTKSSYYQFVSSTARNYRALMFVVSNFVGATDSTYSYDLAIGAAASEQIIVADFCGYVEIDDEVNIDKLLINRHVPAGSRLSWRFQSGRSSASNYVMAGLYGLY